MEAKYTLRDHADIKHLLLETLIEQGGSAETTLIYELLSKKFNLTKDELALRKESDKTSAWNMNVRSARQRLACEKAIGGEVRGTWIITQTGIKFWKSNIIKNKYNYINNKSSTDDLTDIFTDIVMSDDILIEGGKITISVNKYKRNKSLRNLCLAYHGYNCKICKFNFKQYGPLLESLIHVHHILPISIIGENNRTNPITDLCPICPNCHAVIHAGGGCRSPDEVKKMILDNTAPN